MKQLKIGLSSEQLEQLRQVFARHTLIEEVLVYGSRAKGNYHERSDLDLALKGRLDRHLLAAIKLDLEETDLPLGFDVLNYQEINNALLKDHIDRVGVVIYSQ